MIYIFEGHEYPTDEEWTEIVLDSLTEFYSQGISYILSD